MLIIKILVGFLCIFCISSLFIVVEEWEDAPLACKITVGIISIMGLVLLAYCIGELFL